MKPKHESKFETLLESLNLHNTQTMMDIAEVCDTAFASKLWLEDNFGTHFTAADTLKLTKMILKNSCK